MTQEIVALETLWNSLPVRCTRAGDWRANTRPAVPLALLPGAFNPVHEGHWGLAQAAQDFLQLPVAFELSVTNVDKPPLTVEEAQRRLAQFSGKAEVWLTRAPRFVDKARLFPGATFVVGVDTALRIVAPRYHEQNESKLLEALAFFRLQGCRFLVVNRLLASGVFQGMEAVRVPTGYDDIFLPLPPERFRCDVSSTDLRRACGQG